MVRSASRQLCLWSFLLVTASNACAQVSDAEKLIQAAARGPVEDLERLLASRPSPQILSDALAAAALSGNSEIVPVLIRHGVDVNRPSEWAGGRRPLAIAVQQGHRRIAEELAQKGAKVQTPQEMAALGLDDLLRTALENSRELLTAGTGDDTDRQPLLQVAAQHGRLSTIRLLLKAGVDVRQADSRGMTALHVAARHGRTAAVHLLLDEGADLHARMNVQFSGNLPAGAWTPFHLAFAGNHASTMRALLRRGAKLDDPVLTVARMLDWATEQPVIDLIVGETPRKDWPALLKEAVENNRPGIIECLVRRDVDVTGELWGAPLHWSLAHGDRRLAMLFIRRGADVSQVYNSNTPLSEAAQRGQIEIIRALLARKAGVDAGATTGTTPLQFAVFHRNVRAVRLLLKHGADPSRIKPAEWTSLNAATDPSAVAIRELLKK